ncbi:MAG TPA: response regulator [Thermoplasmata archaeon]|jgi:CheY-like chemotaxis protein|nr:response regulator [Thermoplasmata archaeon]
MDYSGPGLRTLTAMSGGVTTKGSSRAEKVSSRIFIVDDQDFIRDLYRDMFESQGHTVFSARSGDEAIKILKTMPEMPDAIIMDHRMPGKNGIETTKEILSTNPTIPIIFSSADEEVREKAMEAGAVSFWTKPFPVRMLIDATTDIIKAKKR